jgi:hypothetical protein
LRLGFFDVALCEGCLANWRESEDDERERDERRYEED